MSVATLDPRPVLLDTSAAIAFVFDDHPAHAVVLAATRGRRIGLAGHAWYETFAVLTGMPGARRRSPAAVVKLLQRDFPGTMFLGPAAAHTLGATLADTTTSSGAVYDALVAAVALEHGLPLLTGDRRATRTYEAVGVTVEWVG